jgi:hypothetical protein
MESALPRSIRRLSCRLWGHAVHNETFKRASGPARRCRCGEAYLPENGATTHVRHTLSCFLRHHTSCGSRTATASMSTSASGAPIRWYIPTTPIRSRIASDSARRSAMRAGGSDTASGHSRGATGSPNTPPLRAQFPQARAARDHDPASAGLFLQSPPRQVPVAQVRLPGVRLHRLRSPVLLRGSTEVVTSLPIRVIRGPFPSSVFRVVRGPFPSSVLRVIRGPFPSSVLRVIRGPSRSAASTAPSG